MMWLLKPTLPLLLVLTSLGVNLSSCTFLAPDDDLPEYPAKIDSIEAPTTVEVGNSFEVGLKGTMGCRELSQVEEERDGQAIRFVVWTHEKDNICGVMPAPVEVTRTLSLDQAGTYEIEAGEATASLLVE